MNNRNTKQKQIILETLMEDQSHPTILELYQKIIEKDHSVGQATVYRNVNKLVQEGKIKRIPTVDDVDHYDGDCRDHYHLVCRRCGKIVDIFDENVSSFLKKIEKKHLVRIEDYCFLLEGVCCDCWKKGKNEKISL